MAPSRDALWRKRFVLNRKHAFAPVADARTRVLVCGSLPGEASLAAGRYYAHPRNQFWRLAGAGAGIPHLATLPYDERLEALLAAGVGLWDVARSARRSGSLDSALRAVEPSMLADLAADLPALRAVAFNGAAAARIGRRQLVQVPHLALIDLPSSSPAYCRVTFEEKRQAWMRIAPFVHRQADRGRLP